MIGESSVSGTDVVRCGGAPRPTLFVFGRFEGTKVAESVLEAIKQGQWDYEPDQVEGELFDSTEALPGTDEKLEILADRVREGLPLWHPRDRRTYDDGDDF